TSWVSIAARASSSPAAALARSITSMFERSVPAFENGVRQPSTIATRPCALRRASRPTAVTVGFCFEPVHTVSARSEISSRALASFGGGSGKGGGPDAGASFGSADRAETEADIGRPPTGSNGIVYTTQGGKCRGAAEAPTSVATAQTELPTARISVAIVRIEFPKART